MTRERVTNTDGRPADFDALLVRYMPGLRSLASKFGRRGEDAHNLVTDTVIEALERWDKFKPDQGKIWTWLYWIMRGIHSNRSIKDKKAIKTSDKSEEVLAIGWPIDANQDDYVELSQTLDYLKGRDREILLRRAMGDELAAIGKDMGLGRERVRQLEELARNALVSRMRRARVAARFAA